MRRGEKTPLGVAQDWWDRTEAQVRAALHAHILTLLKRRLLVDRHPEYERVPKIPREAPGCNPRQRPQTQT
eukprot:11435232-Karenia_brevis.AAC.1